MQQLNNLDVVILIIVGISALIALSRGLVKEVLSIIGWVLGIASIVYLLPIFNPIASMYIKSGMMAGVVTSLFILIVFLIFWIMITGKIISKIRNSKLSNIDRILGLFFGIVRAFLLVVLLYILINWMVPKDKQSKALTESKYFNIAGEFAKPIEKLIPESTLEAIRAKTSETGKSVSEDEKNAEIDENGKEVKKNDATALFEKLAQPQIKKKTDKPVLEIKGNFDGYNEHERDNLDRLIENTLE